MLGDLPEHKDEWLGFRPTLTDFAQWDLQKLQKYILLLRPSSSRLDANQYHVYFTGMIAKENTNLNLDPYSSLRFN